MGDTNPEQPSRRRAAHLVSFLSRRGRLLGTTFVAAGTLAAIGGAPAEPTPEAVAAALGRSVGGAVSSDAFVWQRGEGARVDYWPGRPVVFIAEIEDPDGTRTELFRARAALTQRGGVRAVSEVVAITDTPSGREADLRAAGDWVAVSTRTESGAVAALSAFHFAGAPQARGLLKPDGDLGPTRRIEVLFERLPADVDLELQDEMLVFSMRSTEQSATVGAVALSDLDDVPDGRPLPIRVDKADRFGVHATVATPFVGQTKGVSDWLDLWVDPARPSGQIADAGTTSLEEEPEPLPFAFPPEDSGDHPWRPVDAMAPIGFGRGVAPAPFARRDGDGEGAASLVAWDPRQLEVVGVAGTAFPRPQVAGHGPGDYRGSRMPIGAFVGANPPPGKRGGGAIFQGRIFEAPRPGVMSFAQLVDGRVLIGPYPQHSGAPHFLQWLRQSVPRSKQEDQNKVSRAAVCLLRNGVPAYALASAATNDEYMDQLRRAGCERVVGLGASLEMAAFYRLDNETRANLSKGPEPLIESVGLDVAGFFEALPFESFYLVPRRVRPPFEASGLTWGVVDAEQSAPQWLPSLFELTTRELGTDVRVVAIAPNRYRYRIRAGEKERRSRTGDPLPKGLGQHERADLLATIGLSNGRRKRTRGLKIMGVTGHRFRSSSGALVVDGREIAVIRSEEVTDKDLADATELPLVVDEGQLTDEARTLGELRSRGALCVSSGWVLMAYARFDSHEATASVLSRLGCRLVVALDRGTHEPSYLQLVGGEAALDPAPLQTTLFIHAAKTDSSVNRW